MVKECQMSVLIVVRSIRRIIVRYFLLESYGRLVKLTSKLPNLR